MAGRRAACLSDGDREGGDAAKSRVPRNPPATATFVILCSMRIHVLPTPEIAAERAAEWLRTEIGRASAQRGRCLVALSGGRTPWRMLRDLRRLRVHWHDLQVFQVDERVVPENDERRNARQIADLLVAPAMLHAAQFDAKPVERSNLGAGCRGVRPAAQRTRRNAAGTRRGPTWDGRRRAIPPRWLPGDRLLEEHDRDVGSVPYPGVPRMTLTFRVLDAARHRLSARHRRRQGGGAAEIVGWRHIGACRARTCATRRSYSPIQTAAVELPAEIRSPR